MFKRMHQTTALTILLLVTASSMGCESSPKKDAKEQTDPPKKNTGASTSASTPRHTRATLESKAWCDKLQELPAFTENLGKQTFSDPEQIKARPDQCAYFGENGSLDIAIVAVGENEAVAKILFEAVTQDSPADDATKEEVSALKTARLATFTKKLEDANADDLPEAKTQLEALVAQSVIKTKGYTPIENMADAAALQTQASKALGTDLRYIYIRQGNAILMFLPRPQGKFANWDETYARVKKVMPGFLTYLDASRVRAK